MLVFHGSTVSRHVDDVYIGGDINAVTGAVGKFWLPMPPQDTSAQAHGKTKARGLPRFILRGV